MKNALNSAIAAALFLVAGGASAAALSVSPAVATAAPGAGNATNPGSILVNWDNTGSTADGIEVELTFDDVDLNASVAGSCNYVADSGTVVVVASDALGNTIASGTLCTITFTTDAGATDGESKPLVLQNPVLADGVNPLPAPDLNNGVINIAAAPPAPPTVTFNPNGGPITLTAAAGADAGTLSNATPIAVTAVGGVAPGAGSYTCTVPANFQVTNPSNPTVTAGTDPADMSVTCTLTTAVQNANMTCNRTGADVTPVNFALSCPAGEAVPAPVLASTPANGTTLTCNGAAGAQTTTQATIRNTGNADMTGVACVVSGANFTLMTPPAATIPGGGQSNAVVQCTVPAEGAPAATGTLDCTTTAPAGGALSFPLSSIAQVIVAPSQPETIPSTSLWSKLGLIGLLAALGVLVVGFRRQS